MADDSNIEGLTIAGLDLDVGLFAKGFCFSVHEIFLYSKHIGSVVCKRGVAMRNKFFLKKRNTILLC